MNTPAELKTINPATEEIVNQYQIMTKEQIDDKVKKARSTFQDWKIDIDKRAGYLYAGCGYEILVGNRSYQAANSSANGLSCNIAYDQLWI